MMQTIHTVYNVFVGIVISKMHNFVFTYIKQQLPFFWPWHRINQIYSTELTRL